MPVISETYTYNKKGTEATITQAALRDGESFPFRDGFFYNPTRGYPIDGKGVVVSPDSVQLTYPDPSDSGLTRVTRFDKQEINRKALQSNARSPFGKLKVTTYSWREDKTVAPPRVERILKEGEAIVPQSS